MIFNRKSKKAKELLDNEKAEEITSRFSGIDDLSLIKEEDLSEEEKILYQEEKKKREGDKSKFDEAEQKASKKSEKKKKIWTIILFFVNLGVVAGLLTYQLLQEPFVSLEGLGFNVYVFLILVLVFCVGCVFDISSLSYLIKKDTGRFQMALGFKTAMVGKYYDNITPLSIGGEPMQVAYLKKHDVSLKASLSIPVAKMVFHQFAFFILSIMALIVSSVDSSIGSFASIASIIGFVISFSYLGFIIFLSISKNVGKKLVVGVLKFLKKIRIIKDYEKIYKKVLGIVEDYQMIFKEYLSHFKDFIIMFGTALIKTICMYSMPFIIYCCFFPGGTFDLFFKFFVCGVLIDLASSFIPLPGGTGMNELTFSALFGTFFSGGRLFWAIILWRMVSYYIYIIIGFFVVSYDISIGNRKFRWKKKERELQEESLQFKQEQIQKFRKERATRRKKEIKGE